MHYNIAEANTAGRWLYFLWLVNTFKKARWPGGLCVVRQAGALAWRILHMEKPADESIGLYTHEGKKPSPRVMDVNLDIENAKSRKLPCSPTSHTVL